ncbi:hypothetical protein CEQ90_02845 [Lewinellaceae bacterium SD302]|nr:hypothetical protein CEQ90_02845 [Lewinellaceae bacterium SD302]
MTAYPNPDHRNSSVYKIQLIEKITQLEDLAIIRQIAEQLGIDLDATDVEGIKRTPGVVGGRARIGNRRIPVWLIIDFLINLKVERSKVLSNYPELSDEDLDRALKYYGLHKSEIDADIAENSEEE